MNGFKDITYEQNGQCLKKILREGYGDEYPREGNLVSMNYTVKLLDNTLINSNLNPEDPFKLVIKKGALIKGWEVGIPTMKRNEVAIFYVKPSYGYGRTPPNPNIPPNANVIFEIKLLDWEGEHIAPGNQKDAIIRYVINDGCGSTYPELDSIVEVKYVGKYNGIVFDENKLTFELGMSAQYNLPEGFEEAVQKFLVKEKSRIVIKPLYSFGQIISPKFGIPMNSTIEYTIELLSLQKASPLWLMSQRDFFDRVSIYYTVATDFFNEKQFEIAFRIYRNSFRYLDFKETPIDGNNNTYSQSIEDLFKVIDSNLLQCCFKMDDCFGDKKRVIEENNNPPLEYVEQDINQFLQIQPNNLTTEDQWALCDKKFKKYYRKANLLKKVSRKKKKKMERTNKLCRNWVIQVQENLSNHSNNLQQLNPDNLTSNADKPSENI